MAAVSNTNAGSQLLRYSQVFNTLGQNVATGGEAVGAAQYMLADYEDKELEAFLRERVLGMADMEVQAEAYGTALKKVRTTGAQARAGSRETLIKEL